MIGDYCSRCGECCSSSPLVRVTRRDTIKWYFTGRKDIMDSTRKENGIRHIRLRDNGECIYLSFDYEGLAVCDIYDSRPLLCRMHPLSPDKRSANRTPSCTA